MFKSVIAAASLFASVALTVPAHAEYLVNGGFETGDFTGWDTVGVGSFNFVTSQQYNNQSAPEGLMSAFVGAVGPGNGLSQTFTDTPGQQLTITGYVASDGFAANVYFLFNGTPIVTLNPLGEQPWTHYTETVTATGLDTFEVIFRNDDSFSAIDGFSILAVSAVPEPSTWLMIIAGFAGLALYGRVKRKSGDTLAATS